MNRRNRSLLLIVVVAILLLAACSGSSGEETSKPEPAVVEPIAGTEFNRVKLTERAAERLGVQTDVIREMDMNGQQVLVAPYAAVLYGLNGETWLYVNPEPLVYHREPITVDYIEGDMAVLTDGPPPGTAVVTVAVAQIYGTDTGVGK